MTAWPKPRAPLTLGYLALVGLAALVVWAVILVPLYLWWTS